MFYYIYSDYRESTSCYHHQLYIWSGQPSAAGQLLQGEINTYYMCQIRVWSHSSLRDSGLHPEWCRSVKMDRKHGDWSQESRVLRKKWCLEFKVLWWEWICLLSTRKSWCSNYDQHLYWISWFVLDWTISKTSCFCGNTSISQTISRQTVWPLKFKLWLEFTICFWRGLARNIW